MSVSAQLTKVLSLSTSSYAEEEEKKESKDGVVYEEARSYLWAELQLQRPLVPKRPSSVLAERYVEVRGH